MLAEQAFDDLPPMVDHAHLVGELPLIHHNPFNRMLVEQALADRLTIVTRPPEIARYRVGTLTA